MLIKRLVIVVVCVFNSFYCSGQNWEQINNSVNGLRNSLFFGLNTTMRNNGNVFAATNGLFNDRDQGTKPLEVKAYQKVGTNWVQLGQTLKEETPGDYFGSSIHMAAQANRLAIGISRKSGPDTVEGGAVQVYRILDDNWVPFGNEIFGTSSNGTEGGGVGHSVRLSNAGTFLIVGNPGNSEIASAQGRVIVYEMGLNGNWERVGQELNGEVTNAFFGESVDINGTGNIIAVGSKGSNIGENVGTVSFYKLINNVWVPLGDKIIGNPGEGTGTDIDLNFSGDRIIVRKALFDNAKGKATVYQFKNNNWVQLGQDILGLKDRSGLLGISINAFGNIIALGRIFEGTMPRGTTTVYHLLNEIWTPIGAPINSEEGAIGREFNGYSVDLSADGFTLLTSSPSHEVVTNPQTAGRQGQVRVFDFSPPNCNASFINFQDMIVIPTDAGSCSIAANVCLEQPKTNDCIGMIVQTDAPATFPVGDTVVNWFAFSTTGENETRSQIVRVKEFVPPLIRVPENQTVEIMAGNTGYQLPDYIASGDATASDNCSAVDFSQTTSPGTILQQGIYNIGFIAIDASSNSSQNSFELTVTQPTLGIDNNFSNHKISLYPNPTKNSFRINNPSSIQLNGLKIYDIVGKELTSIDLKKENKNLAINVSHLPKALYFVSINSEKGEVIKKIIVD